RGGEARRLDRRDRGRLVHVPDRRPLHPGAAPGDVHLPGRERSRQRRGRRLGHHVPGPRRRLPALRRRAGGGRRGAARPEGHARADADDAALVLGRGLPTGPTRGVRPRPGTARDVDRPHRRAGLRRRAAVAALPRPDEPARPGSRDAERLSYARQAGGPVETFLVIGRNAVIITVALTAFAAAGVAIATWFARHTHEPH